VIYKRNGNSTGRRSQESTNITAQVDDPKNPQTSQHLQNDQQIFDEETMNKIQSYLAEIEYKESQRSSSIKTNRFIKFTDDKEQKRLSFTGKFDKEEKPATDFKTGEIIPGKFVTRYYLECHDITDPSKKFSEPEFWERGIKDAKTILYYLSKKIYVLEVTRNGQRGSKNTTYTIVPYISQKVIQTV